MSKVEITPSVQNVYPWGVTGISSEVQQSLTKTYSVIGNNIILDGFESTISYTDTNVNILIQPGKAVQDSSFLELENSENLTLNVTSLNPAGKLVSYIFFSGESSEFKLGLVYLNSSNIGDWDELNNKIILNIFKFTLDTYHRINSFYKTEQNHIEINSKIYYKKGLHHDNVNISQLLTFLGRKSKYINSDYTADFNDLIFADTSTDAFTIYLPQSAPIGSHITIIDSAGTFWEHSLALNPNGSKINNIASQQFLRFKNSVTDIYYSGEQNGWIFNVTRMWALKGGTF